MKITVSRRPALSKQAVRRRRAVPEVEGQPAAVAPSAAEPQQQPDAAKDSMPVSSKDTEVEQMPALAEAEMHPVDHGDQCAPGAGAASQMQQQPAGFEVPRHNVDAEDAAAEGTLPHTGGREEPEAMELCHAPAEGHVAATPSIGADPTVTSNGSGDAGGPAAAGDPTDATLTAVAHQALSDAQQARKPSAPRPAVGEATSVPAADSTAAHETTSAAAAAHKAHMRSAQAQLAARARWKKHRQNSSAAASALPVDVRTARQPVVLPRTRAQRVPSPAADQPAGEGMRLSMAQGTSAAAPGSGRLPAPEEADLPADADADCDDQRPTGDSEPRSATVALHRLSPHEQAAARARCYWLHPPWMTDHPPPPHLQVRHTN